MTHKLEGYLRKRTELERYPLALEPTLDKPHAVVVIPALAEADNLPNTLHSLTQCNPAHLETTLILVVVNNRPAEYIDPEIIHNNQRTMKWLKSFHDSCLRLNYIDASTPGNELKPKEGVGAARKIGMDRALACLCESDSESPLIICLDADTLVESNYLDALYDFAQECDAWAGVIDYAHPLPQDECEQEAIVSYELFLRYQHLALLWAQSPYAFHTIGSTIVCTSKAYAAVSGMNRRAAGEDFYFLQQLAKTGSIRHIHDTTVYPSARISWRVPFGTGKRVGRFIQGTHEEYKVYNCASYAVVRKWLLEVKEHLSDTAESLLIKAETIHPALKSYLEQQNFDEHWPKLQKQASNDEKLGSQFNAWFDAFKTLKLIHHLRDEAFPDQPTFEAYCDLSKLSGDQTLLSLVRETEIALHQQVQLLNHLRITMRKLS